jgi:polyhydroxyalkanoate synthesis regulator phasin
MEKIKKRLAELEENVKKHTSAATHADKKRLDDLEARLKALEEKVKNKL